MRPFCHIEGGPADVVRSGEFLGPVVNYNELVDLASGVNRLIA